MGTVKNNIFVIYMHTFFICLTMICILPYMTHKQKLISIASYNSNGSSADRISYINRIRDKFDILLLQEHWLYNSQISQLENQLDLQVHGISSMNECELTSGRPHGGCAIMWKKDLQYIISPAQFNTNRMCGVTVNINNVMYLIRCIYMPCDTIGDHANAK